MAPLYKKALIIGATSGIGEALAKKLANSGTRVVAVGRRQERLDALAASHPDIATVCFDITSLSEIPAFAAATIAAHPDIDSLILNAGIQRTMDLTRPETVNLTAFSDELTTNYTSQVHLVLAFLPYLQKLAKASDGSIAHIVFIGATIGLIPSLNSTPNYNASKAALHSFATNLRQQLIEGGYARQRLRVVEVFPPAVQTELHDEKHQPELVNGGEIGMPLEPFTEALYAKLESGKDVVGIGPVEPWLEEGGWEFERQKLYQKLHPILTKTVEPYLRK